MEEKNTITLYIENGGIAFYGEPPKGVKIIIRDYDYDPDSDEDIGDSRFGDDNSIRDEDGNVYQEIVLES